MTPTRQHLRAAREAHRARRYPGDLAADVLRHERSWRWVLVPSAVAAAAIAVVISILVHLVNAPVRIEMAEVAEVEQAASEAVPGFMLGSLPPLEIPSAPEEFSLAIEAPSFAVPIPAFPTLSEAATEESNSTTQEAT